LYPSTLYGLDSGQWTGHAGDWSLLLRVHSATLLLKTDKNQAALVYRHLLDRNPENSSYFYGLAEAIEPCE